MLIYKWVPSIVIDVSPSKKAAFNRQSAISPSGPGLLSTYGRPKTASDLPSENTAVSDTGSINNNIGTIANVDVGADKGHDNSSEDSNNTNIDKSSTDDAANCANMNHTETIAEQTETVRTKDGTDIPIPPVGTTTATETMEEVQPPKLESLEVKVEEHNTPASEHAAFENVSETNGSDEQKG
ncbi:hypothetical protein FGIG_06316 [Fasciola gigantica]|uniref:Uncharacterized protein n=1 Tax=Fasciola gigantica TaxID=46835 RepID=A0A504YZX1_FASGI|nr:hypothetical protein FGIG_06316 [Fasciola gigantica]